MTDEGHLRAYCFKPQRGAASNRRRLEAEWAELCDSYLPVESSDSPWRYSRHSAAGEPEQGWKLHISATILTANKILGRAAPMLRDVGTMFKAPASLGELQRINCGLYYGFSQVGKFITVYTRDAAEACAVAAKLHSLVSKFAAPAVPFDARYRHHGCLFYRYGAFSPLELELPDGTRRPAIRNPSNELVVDRREPGAAVPDWITDPFPQPFGPRRGSRAPSPLKTTVRAYQALSQRGKGGVYRAFDASATPVRQCILKEGRRHGETDWDGRDGYWRVRHEKRVLSSLRDAGVDVPRVHMFFESGRNCYLVLESVDGVNLQKYLADRGHRLTIRESLKFGAQTAGLLESIHGAGWVWRDCKPLNLLVTNEGILRPLDFEGACPIGLPDGAPWGTPGYAPPESLDESVKNRLPEDLYALGATLSQLFTGRPPMLAEPASSLKSLRPDVPASVEKLVGALLDPAPHKRLDAGAVRRGLERESAKRGARGSLAAS